MYIIYYILRFIQRKYYIDMSLWNLEMFIYNVSRILLLFINIFYSFYCIYFNF